MTTDAATALGQFFESLIANPSSPWSDQDWFELRSWIEKADTVEVRRRANDILRRLWVEWAAVQKVEIDRSPEGHLDVKMRVAIGEVGEVVSVRATFA